jgi:hypothetical protein
MSNVPNFSRGAESLEKASEKQQSFNRTAHFSLKDGESTLIRVVTEYTDWITVKQHGFVPTRPQPANWPGQKWPPMMGAVCRHDRAFFGIYDDCIICDKMQRSNGKPYKPTSRGWAVAVLREEVRNPDGSIAGVKDKKVTVPKLDDQGKPIEGETIEIPEFVWLNFAWDNFFSKIHGTAAYYGTVVDRDFFVKRKGIELDTDYQIAAMDRLPLENMAERYAAAPDLGAEVARMASDDYYDTWWGNKTFSPKDSNGQNPPAPATTPPPVSQGAPPADDDARREALRQRLGEFRPEGTGGQSSGVTDLG